eukprot:SAG11_NODE_467_length_9212_cov_2.153627_3_plen_171_part_00
MEEHLSPRGVLLLGAHHARSSTVYARLGARIKCLKVWSSVLPSLDGFLGAPAVFMTGRGVDPTAREVLVERDDEASISFVPQKEDPKADPERTFGAVTELTSGKYSPLLNGLREGQRVVAVNGSEVTSLEDFEKLSTDSQSFVLRVKLPAAPRPAVPLTYGALSELARGE